AGVLPTDRRVAAWLFSAGGRNEDIRSAFRSATMREPEQLAVVCGDGDSPLVKEAREYSWVDTLALDLPTRDGFLATGSTLAFALLLLRGFLAANGDAAELPRTYRDFLV